MTVILYKILNTSSYRVGVFSHKYKQYIGMKYEHFAMFSSSSQLSICYTLSSVYQTALTLILSGNGGCQWFSILDTRKSESRNAHASSRSLRRLSTPHWNGKDNRRTMCARTARRIHYNHSGQRSRTSVCWEHFSSDAWNSSMIVCGRSNMYLVKAWRTGKPMKLDSAGREDVTWGRRFDKKMVRGKHNDLLRYKFETDFISSDSFVL